MNFAQNVGKIDNRALDSISTVEALPPHPTSTSSLQQLTFTFPVGTVLGIPFTVLFYGLGSFLSRLERIYYFLPSYLTFLSVLIPAYSIMCNQKMRKKLKENLEDNAQNLLASWKKKRSGRIIPYP